MQPNSPLFRSGVQPRELWSESRVLAGEARQLRVFRWENRLVCHEDATGLWWATLDPFEGEDARKFWQLSIESGRVARLTALRRGFELRQSDAHLAIEAQWFDVLVEQNNGGRARAQGASQWHAFAPALPRRLSKPLARVPSLWSPRFSTEFGRRSLRDLAPIVAGETLVAAPPVARELWRLGANTPAIRLAIAANMQGWVEQSYNTQTAPEFWEMAMLKASRRLPVLTHLLHSLGRNPFSLPNAMRQSPHLAPQLRLKLTSPTRPSHHKDWASWRAKEFALTVYFWPQLDSAHQKLEAKLELRDWLGQFFPPDEVTKWIQ